MTDTAPSWRERLRPLSPLSVVLAAGVLASGWVVPRAATSMLRMAREYGHEPSLLVHFAASFGWYVLVVLLVSLLVAKDWWLRTERGRVWANLALWLLLGVGFAVVGSALMQPLHDVATEFGEAGS